MRALVHSRSPSPLQFILGNTGFHSASISHAPSNAQLLLRGMRSVKSLVGGEWHGGWVGVHRGGRGE